MEAAVTQTEAIYSSLTSRVGYTARVGQRRMAEIIARTVAPEHVGHKRVVVEGPTGTGKTFAYLSGAFPAAQQAGKTLLIATATVGLQEQILAHDVPLFEAAWGAKITACIAKGRARYVCDRALQIAGGRDPAQGGFAFGEEPSVQPSDLWREPPTAEQRDQIEQLVIARGEGWNGDLDALPGPCDTIVREKITLGASGCAGRSCPAFTRCAFRLARRAAAGADIVVTNHDMLLSDAALGGGVLLPKLSESILVIDEAHALHETAIDAFTNRLPFAAAERVLAKLPTLLTRISSASGARAGESQTESAQTALGMLREELEKLAGTFAYRLEVPVPGARTGTYASQRLLRRWEAGEQPDVVERADTVARCCVVLLKALRRDRERLADSDRVGVPGAVAADMTAQAGMAADMVRRVGRWAEAIAFAATAPATAAPTALWIEAETQRGRAELVAVAAPTQAAPQLRAQLFDQAYACILTSATLRTLGTFSHVVRRLGLSEKDGTQCLAIDSPYDLARQGEIVVPACATDPKDDARHTDAVLESVIRDSSSSAGTLVLFSSRKQMQAVYDRLPPDIRTSTRLPSADARAKVLAEHRAATAAGRRAILFGLEGFAAGLDLPGRECEVVIITRLPFSPPDGPIAEKLAEWLSARGRSFFVDEAIPDAFRRLVQRLGRLIRSETDRGRILILDRRIISTTYGKRMWDALPPYSKTIEPMKRCSPV